MRPHQHDVPFYLAWRLLGLWGSRVAMPAPGTVGPMSILGRFPPLAIDPQLIMLAGALSSSIGRVMHSTRCTHGLVATGQS